MYYKILFSGISIFIGLNLAMGQQKIDTALKIQLDEIMIKDQQYRKLMDFQGTQKDSLARHFNIPNDSLGKYLWSLQNKNDSSDWNYIEIIFLKKGYPGKTLVGESTNEVAWYILQHNLQKIQKYFL